MQLGMVGLGRMGANMTRRLLKAGHEIVAYDRNATAVTGLAGEGAVGAASREELCARLARPRAIWLMLPAAVVDGELAALGALLDPGDVLIDGGNSYYRDDIRRGRELRERGLHYVDVGTSGGVWGLRRGYCLMVGGEAEVVQRLGPIFAALAPGRAAAPPTPPRADGTRTAGTAEEGYLHCGPNGAGHFVKMVHNGIEYGLMEAYAEGFNILRNANAGRRTSAASAETTPLGEAEFYLYDLELGEIAEVWRRGSVVASWLLDLAAIALRDSPDLAQFSGHVSDSGEGRWTIDAAIDEGIPAPVLSAALFARFSSRGEATFADKLLSALRYEFGGHLEQHTMP